MTIIPATVKCWVAYEDHNTPIIAWAIHHDQQNGPQAITADGYVKDMTLVRFDDVRDADEMVED